MPTRTTTACRGGCGRRRARGSPSTSATLPVVTRMAARRRRGPGRRPAPRRADQAEADFRDEFAAVLLDAGATDEDLALGSSPALRRTRDRRPLRW